MSRSCLSICMYVYMYNRERDRERKSESIVSNPIKLELVVVSYLPQWNLLG